MSIKLLGYLKKLFCFHDCSWYSNRIEIILQKKSKQVEMLGQFVGVFECTG